MIGSLSDVSIFKIDSLKNKGIYKNNTIINSIYTYDKIINLFKNFETLSFIDSYIKFSKIN